MQIAARPARPDHTTRAGPCRTSTRKRGRGAPRGLGCADYDTGEPLSSSFSSNPSIRNLHPSHSDLDHTQFAPQAQWALLRRSFAGVKTEFADLDGMSWNRRGPVFVQSSASAPAPAPAARPGRPKGARGPTRPSSVCASASAPVLSLDDGTVRPGQGRKRRRCIGIGAWVGKGDYVNGSTIHDYNYEHTAPPVA